MHSPVVLGKPLLPTTHWGIIAVGGVISVKLSDWISRKQSRETPLIHDLNAAE